VCTILALPVDDPLPGQATLTSLSLSLAAMASSLRVFGAERLEFTREQSSGSSTGAYYLGKSLSHLPVILISPLLFTLAFYPLAGLPSGMAVVYALYVSVYFITAGMAYLVSVSVPMQTAHLTGVLVSKGNIPTPLPLIITRTANHWNQSA
jgi:hypothetical protein